MTIKTCTVCLEEKPVTSFDMKKGKPRSSCKVCVARYTHQHYLSKKEYYIERAKINRKNGQERLRKFLFQYKKEHPCVDCGESDPIVLEFDHIKEKADGLASMATRALMLSRLLEEIAKCEVVCANCHKRRTAKRTNWYNKSLTY